MTAAPLSPPLSPDLVMAAEIGEDFEGWSATPYLDRLAKPPVWTTGYGSTRWFDGSPVGPHTPAITRSQGTALAAMELRDALAEVDADVRVPLSFAEKAALEDFIYNVGRGAFRSSTLLRKLNAGDLNGAADEFLKWDVAGGVHLAGLARRRAAERAMMLNGVGDGAGGANAPSSPPAVHPAPSQASADSLMASEQASIDAGRWPAAL